MVKKGRAVFYVIKVIKDVVGRMVRAERIFKSLIDLEVCQNYYGVF